MSACYREVSPDPERNEKAPRFQQNPFAYTGVFELWGKRDESRTDNITSLGAWALRKPPIHALVLPRLRQVRRSAVEDHAF